MAATPRLALPFISVGQAQKEVTHNEGLQTLDILVCGAIDEPPRPEPPESPQAGTCYIVSDGASGLWAGKASFLAAWTTGGWRFIAPVDGMSLYERTTGTWATFRSGAWEIGVVSASMVQIDGQQVVGPRGPAIQSPAGGAVVDAEARAALEAVLNTLRQHGLIAA
jgi:hypothetical protein